MFSTRKNLIEEPKTYTHSKSLHAAELLVDPRTDDGEHITDMFYQMSGDQFGGLCFLDFIFVLIKELKVGRKQNYVRLYLYPLETDFTGDYFAIFIRKRDLYVVGVQDVNKKVYEIGQPDERYRYFDHSEPTGFGQQYEFLFSGSHGNLLGIWVGHDVLNEAIMRVILHTAGYWAWSIGIFALMFSECSRFIWYHDKLPEIMEARQNIRMMGQYRFMKVLPKFWTKISDCARKDLPLVPVGPQPNNQKYTERGALNLQDIVRWAREALEIKSWEYGRNADNGPNGHIPGDGDGDGYGDGGGTYPPYHRGGNNVAPGGGGDHGGGDTGGENRGGGRRGDGHRGHGRSKQYKSLNRNFSSVNI